MSKKKDLGKILFGATIGIGAGMLFAPKSGKEIRHDLHIKMQEMLEKVKSIDSKSLQKEFDKKNKGT